uniref:Secreted protein n=1 Tax=Syphacia muris TaxID=451379 RepID=A0A0N5B1N2_9BILA
MNASCCGACLCSNAANALSIPPGEYGRKIKTQRNRRGPAQARYGSALLGSLKTGAARLSSARVVRCWVKSRNERNPRP